MKVVIDANWKLYTNTVPKNFEAVGTITDDDGDSGALVVTNRGSIPLYWQLNAGVLNGLPQHEVKAAVELAKLKDHRPTALELAVAKPREPSSYSLDSDKAGL